MNLETERLYIRAFVEEDWKDLYEYLSDEEIVLFMPYDVYTEESCRQEAIDRANNNGIFAVCLKNSNKLIGSIYFSKEKFDSWDLGFEFNRNYQKSGYATEASKAVIQHAFENIKAHRIVARCNPENKASWKCLERLGLRREGHLVKNIYFKTDKNKQPIWLDTYEYAILSHEWSSTGL